METNKNSNLLSLRGLRTDFHLEDGRTLHAVDGIDLTINPGEIHGLVGESGCGKTVTAFSILRLVPPPGYISAGEIIWKNQNLLKLKRKEMRKIRGKEIAMIFQNPQSALNPLYTIGDQMKAVIQLHRPISKKEAMDEVMRLLKVVKIPDPEKRVNDYPHELSGGMCQRIMIAMALSCRPKLLIADEPTAALDVTIQAQILDLLLELKKQFQMAILLISHDMGVVAKMCDRASIMYLGKIVEEAEVDKLFHSPKHPYTQALLKSVPVPDPRKTEKSLAVKGDPPSSIDVPVGCRFRTRCPKAFNRCEKEEPKLRIIDEDGSKVACWLYGTY